MQVSLFAQHAPPGVHACPFVIVHSVWHCPLMQASPEQHAGPPAVHGWPRCPHAKPQRPFLSQLPEQQFLSLVQLSLTIWVQQLPTADPCTGLPPVSTHCDAQQNCAAVHALPVGRHIGIWNTHAPPMHVPPMQHCAVEVQAALGP